MDEPKSLVQVQSAAQGLAKKIGDEEWRKGNTKFALEAYEAACVSPDFLYDLAQKLLKAVGLIEEWREAHHAAGKIPGACKPMDADANKPCCMQHGTQRNVYTKYHREILELLGWEGKPNQGIRISHEEDIVHPERDTRVQLRAATVACLKLIKRM